MAGQWRDLLGSALLLIVLLAAVALGFAVLGGAVLIPLGGVAVWVAIGLLVFIGIELLLFRALGLRSRADQDAEDETPSDDQHRDGGSDWRAWRG